MYKRTVKCSHDLPEPHQSCYGVPQGSVIRPLLSSLYTTSLSSLISSSSLSHNLYADNTQLFISFQPTKFNENISCLQTALSAIADWMTSNLLCFNSAKTEFLLLGLNSQTPILLCHWCWNWSVTSDMTTDADATTFSHSGFQANGIIAVPHDINTTCCAKLRCNERHTLNKIPIEQNS